MTIQYTLITSAFLFLFCISSESICAPLSCIDQINSTSPIHGEKQSPFELFPNRDFHTEYDSIVNELQPGDEILLPSGQIVQIDKLIGQGSLTKILSIGNGWALRIPLKSTQWQSLDSMKGYYELAKELEKEGLPVIELADEQSNYPFALMVKEENFIFRGDQFFNYEEHGWPHQFSQDVIVQARKDLNSFFRKSWKYLDISDATPRQMGFNGTKWILFDFYGYGNPGHFPLRHFSQKQIIMHTRIFEDPDYGDKIEDRLLSKKLETFWTQEITKIRKHQKTSETWYTRSKVRFSDSSEFIDRVTIHPLPKGKTKVFRDLECSFVRCDFKGYFPKNAKGEIEIKIVGFNKTKNNLAKYDGLINDALPVKIEILINGESGKDQKEFYKRIKKLKGIKEPYLSGSDFIIFYSKTDRHLLSEI